MTQFTAESLSHRLQKVGNRLTDRKVLTEFSGQGCDALPADATGNDVLIPEQVSVAVDGESVHRHQVCGVDSDCGDLSIPVDPNTRMSFQSRHDSQSLSLSLAGIHVCGEDLVAHPNHALFNGVDVAADTAVQDGKVRQIDDRIGDQLTQTMECNQSSPIRALEVCTQCSQSVLLLLWVVTRPDADRVNGPVFHKDQGVWMICWVRTGLHCGPEAIVILLLDRQSIAIHHSTQVNDPKHGTRLHANRDNRRELEPSFIEETEQ